MSKFFKVKTKSVINTDLIVKAESEGEAKAKAAAAMYTFLEDDMLFENEMELTEEEIRDVMIPDCEEYEEEFSDDLDPYEDGACDEDYEPPEYFSD